MERKLEIVFFDELGFGWLIDAACIERIRGKAALEKVLIRHSLSELFRKTRPI